MSAAPWAHRVKSANGFWAEVGVSKTNAGRVTVRIGTSDLCRGVVRLDIAAAKGLRRALTKAIREATCRLPVPAAGAA